MAKILVVDDSKMMLKVATDVLSGLGHEVKSAESGEAGLKIAQEEKLDLILLDLMMPGLDGYETCKQFKEDDSAKSVPVIMLTALNDQEAVSKSMEVGAVDYIAKPFEPATLQAKVKKILGK
ncbi:MAG: response regulator [bacterium]|nr:response regulator [Candidatus Margulisiibacteriota bacterium]